MQVPQRSKLICPKCETGVITNTITLRPGDKLHADLFMHLQGSVLRVDEPVTCFRCALVFTNQYLCNPNNWTVADVREI